MLILVNKIIDYMVIFFPNICNKVRMLAIIYSILYPNKGINLIKIK